MLLYFSQRLIMVLLFDSLLNGLLIIGVAPIVNNGVRHLSWGPILSDLSCIICCVGDHLRVWNTRYSVLATRESVFHCRSS